MKQPEYGVTKTRSGFWGTRCLCFVMLAALLSLINLFVQAPRAAAASSADSTAIWGPGKWVKGSPSGSWSYDTDSFTADSILGQRYVLEIWNTACTGVTAVVDSQQWVGSSEVASGSHVYRTIDMGQTGTHSITIGLNGTATTSYIWTRIVRVREPMFIVCPDVYFVKPASVTTQIAYFNAPTGPTQYSMRVTNGLPSGTNRTTSATLWLNDPEVPATFSTGVATGTYNVSISTDGPTNAISFKNTGASASRIKVRVSAVDNSVPVLSVSQPTSGDTAYTKSAVAYFSGSVTDETPGWLTITETTPWLSSTSRPQIATPGAFSDSVTGLAEGWHRFRLQITNSAKLTTTKTVWVVRDATGPTLLVTSPAADVAVTDSTIAFAGNWADSTRTTMTVDDSVLVAGYSGAFSLPAVNYRLDLGGNRVVLRATDALGNATQITRIVFRKPASESAADSLYTSVQQSHPLPTTGLLSFYDQVRFIFRDAQPYQAGVSDTMVFDKSRVSVVRGKVFARDYGPIPNVAVRVLGHPEYGSATTRADGAFDMVVNGGADYTMRFTKAGYLESQRKVSPRTNDFAPMYDVGLVGRSAKRTIVNLNNQTVVLGRFATDLNGDRKLRLLFQAGTTAQIATTSSTAPFNAINLRLTEYTVAGGGPMSMPAELPGGSAYTYCMDFSVDEADSIGQISPQLPMPDVVFSKPVMCYLPNFLQMPIGSAVPYGTCQRL